MLNDWTQKKFSANCVVSFVNVISLHTDIFDFNIDELYPNVHGKWSFFFYYYYFYVLMNHTSFPVKFDLFGEISMKIKHSAWDKSIKTLALY